MHSTMTPDLSFPKSRRLRTPAEFKAVYDAKRSVSDARLVVYAKPNDARPSRIGLSVSRKVGIAVQRVRLRRLLREAFRLHQHELPAGFDFVLVARPFKTEPTLAEYTDSLQTLFASAVKRWGAKP
jgi:ribonuclease P protein component